MDAKQEMKKLVEEFSQKVADLARRMTLEAVDLAFKHEVDTPTLEAAAAKQGNKVARKLRRQAKRAIKRATKKVKKATKDVRADAKADARKAYRIRQKISSVGAGSLSEGERKFITAYNEDHPEKKAKAA